LALGESVRERARETADAAAEVESPLSPVRPVGRGTGEGLLDLPLAARKEGLELPAATATIGGAEDRPERIEVRQLLPVLPVTPQLLAA